MIEYKTIEEALAGVLDAAAPFTLVAQGAVDLDEVDLHHQEDAIKLDELDLHTRITIHQELGLFMNLYQSILAAKAALLKEQLKQDGLSEGTDVAMDFEPMPASQFIPAPAAGGKQSES